MAYEYRAIRRQKVRYNSANDDNALVFQLEEDNAKITPASATIAVYREGVTAALLSATAMTVSGTLMTYALDTTTVATWPVSGSYRADIVVTDGSAVTHEGHIVFDVVKYLLRLGVTRDQLLDRDEGILGAEHGGDESLAPLIGACRDELQLLLETKAHQDGQVIENMIIDSSRLAIPARLYILWKHFNGRDQEKADNYESDWRMLWKAFLGGINYDTNLDGFESGKQGGLIPHRLYT